MFEKGLAVPLVANSTKRCSLNELNESFLMVQKSILNIVIGHGMQFSMLVCNYQGAGLIEVDVMIGYKLRCFEDKEVAHIVRTSKGIIRMVHTYFLFYIIGTYSYTKL